MLVFISGEFRKTLASFVEAIRRKRESPIQVPQTHVSFSLAGTTKRFPSPRCASARKSLDICGALRVKGCLLHRSAIKVKQDINPAKAHLIRGAFYLLLAVSAIPFTLAQSRSRGTTKPGVIKPTVLPNLTSLSSTISTDPCRSPQPGLCPSWGDPGTALESSYRRGGRFGERRHRRWCCRGQ